MTKENSQKPLTANAKKVDAESSQSLGSYLQRERQKKQQTIEEVAKFTRIPPETLKALEAGNRNLLPVAVFTKGFVKIYGAHLGLNQAEILEMFSNEWGEVTSTIPDVLSGESMAESSPFFLSLRFYFLLFFLALLISLAYFFFQADDTPSANLSAVPTTIEEPGEHIVVDEKEIQELKIISTGPRQETPLVSPQSAGKITLAEDESIQDAPLVQQGTNVGDDRQSKTMAASQDKKPEAKQGQTTSSASGTPLPLPLAVIGKPTQATSQPKLSIARPVNLHIRFLKRTHISIAQDDGQPERFIFAPGEESTWQAASHITLHVDAADAVELRLNGSQVFLRHTTNGPLAITLPTDLDG